MKCLVALLCFALAGCAVGDRTPITINVGESFPLRVQTLTVNVKSCYILTPSNQTIELIPEFNGSSKFELQSPTLIFGCAVTVTEANSDDNGEWQVVATTENGDNFSDTEVVYVRGGNELDLWDEDDGDITWLPQLKFVTQIGSEVSIALSKQDYEEVCYFRSPDGKSTLFSDNIENSGIRTSGSNAFVSCKIVIGPIEVSHSGDWALCGTHEKDGTTIVRCQKAVLEWYLGSAINKWEAEERPVINHVVHYGMTLSPAISDFGRDVSFCHVITPSGDDLQITTDSDFDGITRVASAESICHVAIGPIREGYMGNWTLYATFANSMFSITEVRQPIHMFLYDENDPYNQAYNVTTRTAVSHVINLNTVVEHELVSTGQSDDCYIVTPSGEEHNVDKAAAVDGISLEAGKDTALCRVTIGPVTESMLGSWTLIGKFRNNDVFTEIHQSINVIQEDPSNPVEDGVNRRIENLTEEFIETEMGSVHNISIQGRESCHIITPSKLQYILMDGFNVNGVEILEGDDVCGVTIKVISEELIGEWILFSRGQFLGTDYEWRQPFTISVEEIVDAVPKETYIAEGNDLYIRLEDPTALFKTCRLLTPEGDEANDYQLDGRYTEHCGFIVKNVNHNQSGNWTIEYGNTITYKAISVVNIIERWDKSTLHLTWALDAPVNETIGPEDAVYCKIEDQNGVTIFEGFGRCKVSFARATSAHSGVWKMIVGTPGRILTDEHNFTVSVEARATKGVVVPEVTYQDYDILLSCTLPLVDKQIRACKFRDPSGRLLLVNPGVGEDRYVAHGVTESIESSLSNHTCGLHITTATSDDLGIWRCAIETEDEETYFGFLTVYNGAIPTQQDYETIINGPGLKADRQLVNALEGDSIIMSCSISKPILYCYFKFKDTTFAAGYGGTNGTAEYVGAGFDAGECGIRLASLSPQDSGEWTCHVGFDGSATEQSAFIQVEIEEKLHAVQTLLPNNRLAIQIKVHGGRPLSYCRFVKSNGFGFTSHFIPWLDYEFDSSLMTSGTCDLIIPNPSDIDFDPWTVAVKVEGETFEITRQTVNLVPEPPSTLPQRVYRFPFFWIFFISTLTALFMFGVLYRAPEKREWARSRAAMVRRSFRKSILKKPVPEPWNTTTTSA